MILIVDDHRDMRAMLVKLLKMDDLEAIAVGSGEEGLLFLQRHTPRLILPDYSMSGMNGLEVNRELKKDPRLAAIPIILFTAYGKEMEEIARAQGISSFVQKGSLDWLTLRTEIVRLMHPRDPICHEPAAAERAQSSGSRVSGNAPSITASPG